MTVVGRDPSSGRLLQVSVGDHDGGAVITEVTVTDDQGDDDGWLVPGLIDLQVNGFGGHDVNADQPTWEQVAEITAALGALGVTTWCPTVITAAPEQILDRLAAVRAAREHDPATARAVPGVHVEGPFLSAHDGARGVHDPTQVRAVDLDEVDRWLQQGAPLALITLSPHRTDTIEAIPRLVERGLTVALGHTHADPAQIVAAVDAGATVSTHLGNGLAPLQPRHPNVVWTQLADDRLSAGLIADGHHLPDEVLEVMLRAKPADRAFLVSDTTALAGSAPGRHHTAVGGAVELDAAGRLSYPGTGLLAGAVLPLPHGLAHVVARTTVPLAQAVRLVTVNPARLLPVARPGLGRLEPGAPADLLLLDDAATVRRVMVDGRWCCPLG